MFLSYLGLEGGGGVFLSHHFFVLQTVFSRIKGSYLGFYVWYVPIATPPSAAARDCARHPGAM